MPNPEDLPIPPREFERIYAKVPRLTVECVIRTPSGVVLARRDIPPCEGHWHIPGGTVRFGESLRAAVVRVARAEAGVTVRVDKLLGVIEYPGLLAGGYRGWPVGVAFQATVVGGALAGSPHGAAVRAFATLPPDMIAEQYDFLDAHLGMPTQVR